MAAAKTGQNTRHERHVFDGDRDSVRQQTVVAALQLILLLIKD
jgi:nicotinamide mononucleotide (NMN) deamidase PncC